ncbi:MAG: bacterial Ig-like domain-containing protein [Bacteroidales bacterium]|nr:bacterial Ig-like domain-containing protein [Bacteroidales bacterium]
MKKIIFAIMAAGSLFAGCTLETNVENPEVSNKRQVTIQADIVRSKTTVTDEGVYSWSANETIGVVEQDGEEVIPFTIEDAENGLFSGTLSADKDPVFAVSPAAFVSNVAESGGLIEYDITLDNIANYVPGTTNAIMVASYSGKDGDNYRFHFNHVAALVKVSVVNVPVGTAKVKLTLDKNITGVWADLDFTNPVLNEDTELGDPSLTLTLKKAVTNPNTSADYYFPVPCNTYTSFQLEMLNDDGDRLKGVKKTGRNIVLDAGDLFLAPTVTLDPVTIVKGAEWTYTFSAKQYSANGTVTLTDAEDVSMDWTLDGNPADAFLGYDGTKGQQFGSGTKPYSSLTLTADSGVNGIEDVVINTSGAKDIDATVSVSVGGTPFVIKGSDPAKTSQSLTSTATEYTFTSPDGELYVGDIVISYKNSSSKAIYIKTISLNPDTRIDPELAYSPAAYSVVASSSFETPELSSVDGFDGTVTYAIGGEDDPDVASVNAETGAVTIGAKAGSVTVTATFVGNANYKPGSASYTITVGAAALSVSTTTPDHAAYEDDATTTFTVTSNVPWTAVASSNGSYIKGIYVDEEQIDTATPVVQPASADAVTVTVKFNANDGEERSATIAVNPTDQTHYAELNKTVTVTQDEYVAPSGEVFTRISSSDDLTLGTDAEYLLIYVPASGNPLAFNGSLTTNYNGSAGVTVKLDNSGNVDYDTYKGYALTISAANTTNKYWIKTAGGKYIGRNANSNGVDEYTPTEQDKTPTNTNFDNGIAFNSTTGVVTITGNGGRALLYYPTNSNYKYYAASNVANMYLYKYEDATTWDLESIAVKTAPTKTSYEAGEQFDPTGLVITATYSDHDGVKDDKTVDIAYSNATAIDFSFVPSTALTDDVNEVSITWRDKSTTQGITVAAVYAVTFEAPSNGSLTVLRGETELTSGNAVPAGATINVTATPDSGYELSTLVYNDGSDHDIKADKTFTMPANAVSITATFAEIVTPTISMNTTSITNVAAEGGSTTAASAYDLLNGASNDDVTITCDGTVVTAASKNATAGSIDYTVASNSGSARSGWIKVKYGTEEPHEITVSQLAGTVAVTLVNEAFSSSSIDSKLSLTSGSVTNGFAKLGTSKASGAITCTIPQASASGKTLTISFDANAWSTSEKTLSVSVTNGTATSGSSALSSITLSSTIGGSTSSPSFNTNCDKVSFTVTPNSTLTGNVVITITGAKRFLVDNYKVVAE